MTCEDTTLMIFRYTSDIIEKPVSIDLFKEHLVLLDKRKFDDNRIRIFNDLLTLIKSKLTCKFHTVFSHIYYNSDIDIIVDDKLDRMHIYGHKLERL